MSDNIDRWVRGESSCDQDLGLAFLGPFVSQLRYARVRLELAACGEARLPPFLGSTLRGGLAGALKRLVCALRTQDCPECLLRERCHYSVLFETPPDSRLETWQNQQAWPRPIVIEPPALHPEPWVAGETLAFDLVLFGRAMEAFPFVAVAAGKMAEAGLGFRRKRFELVRILDEDGSVLFGAGETALGRPSVLGIEPAAMEADGQHIRVRFVTPTRIFEEGLRTRIPDFRALVKSLLGRVSSLVLFHCGGTPMGDVATALALASGVETLGFQLDDIDLKRWSNRQQQKLPLNGVVGTSDFGGDCLPGFLPLLKAGEVTHIGKGTVFGLGQILVDCHWRVGGVGVDTARNV